MEGSEIISHLLLSSGGFFHYIKINSIRCVFPALGRQRQEFKANTDYAVS